MLHDRAPARVEARPSTGSTQEEGANIGAMQGLGVRHEACALLPSLLDQIGSKESHRSPYKPGGLAGTQARFGERS